MKARLGRVLSMEGPSAFMVVLCTAWTRMVLQRIFIHGGRLSVLGWPHGDRIDLIDLINGGSGFSGFGGVFVASVDPLFG